MEIAHGRHGQRVKWYQSGCEDCDGRRARRSSMAAAGSVYVRSASPSTCAFHPRSTISQSDCSMTVGLTNSFTEQGQAETEQSNRYLEITL